MSFKTVRTKEFQEQLARLPAPVAAAVERRIRRLEEHPGAVSRPAFAPLSKVSQLEYTFQGMDYLLDILFLYGTDETTLHLECLFVETV